MHKPLSFMPEALALACSVSGVRVYAFDLGAHASACRVPGVEVYAFDLGALALACRGLCVDF